MGPVIRGDSVEAYRAAAGRGQAGERPGWIPGWRHDDRIYASDPQHAFANPFIHAAASLGNEEFMHGAATMRHRHDDVSDPRPEANIVDIAQIDNVGVHAVKLIIENFA